MKIYRNIYSDEENNHAGSEWFSSKAEANRVWVARHRAGQVIDGDQSVRAETVILDTKKVGLIALLNKESTYRACNCETLNYEPGGEI